MAYRLKRGENVAEGITRVMFEEMETAATELRHSSNQETAVHEARKSIKKLRALLRLMSPKLKEPYAEANVLLRDAGRLLSALRDAVVLVTTLEAVEHRFAGDPRAKSLGRLRAMLVRRGKKAQQGNAVAHATGLAAAAIEKTTAGAKDWPSLSPGFDAIAPGLESTYRQGRAALAEASRHPSVLSMHDLRKRVKDHWYHVRLLEDVWSDSMKAREKNLKSIETWLGDDHNLSVLLEIAGKAGGAHLESLIGEFQKELRDSALALARKVFEEKPRTFMRSMRFLWDAWQEEPKKEINNLRRRPARAATKRSRAAA